MCLSKVFTDDEMEEWLADKPEVIEVWKVALGDERGLMGPVSRSVYPAGIGIVRERAKVTDDHCHSYYDGFYFFATSLANKNKSIQAGFSFCARGNQVIVVIKCLVKKEWITAVGDSGYWLGMRKKAIGIVASQAVFPHYPETEARREDLPKEESAPVEVAFMKE